MRDALRCPRLAAALLLAAAAPAGAAAQVDARLFRYPDVSADRITFVYANDIWVVPKSGGMAQRLTTPAGEESFPRFSPDGSRIAFSGNYDGNEDVYVISVAGGLPTRVTWHPEQDRMVDWYPDGSALLFASFRTSEKDRYNKLYRVSPSGGDAEKLPMAYGEFGSLSPDARRIAYLPHWRNFRTWKRYRGGLHTDIEIFDLESFESSTVPEDGSNDTDPMWHGETLYFLSDRAPDMRYNIWKHDTRTGQVSQVTRFTDYDIHFPAIGPREIVFEQAGRLWLLDLETEESRPIAVQAVTDLAALRPRAVDVSGEIRYAGISPSGQRAVFEARGDIFTVPAEHGFIRTLTESSASAERKPAWSPDGRSIAYWSDRTGEYELTIEPADGTGEPRTVTRLGPGYRYGIVWSPDSRKVAFIDQAMRVRVTDVESGRTTEVGRGHYFMHGGLEGFDASWSPDSRWLVYGGDLPSRAGAIFAHDTRDGRTHQLTSGFYGASEPVFDPEGKYLYFVTSRHFQPVYSDVENTWIYANSDVIAAVPLTTSTPSPTAPRNDDEGRRGGAAADTTAADTAKDGALGRAGAAPSPVAIDLEGFEARAVILPPPPGQYANLRAVKGKVLYRRPARTGSPQGAPTPVLFWDLEAREEKTILENAGGFEVSADGKKLLTVHQGRWAIVDVAPAQKLEKTLATGDLEKTVDPREEYRQMFADAWRFERDYFYDRDLHGVDWAGLRERYGALVEDAVTREDLNFILGELIAELNASHTYKGGGDLEEPRRRTVGMLGADFEREDGAWRIARILEGAPWDADTRSPLARPGLHVEEGDWVLAVNGQRIDPAKEIWAAFDGLAGKTVELMVNDRPTLEGARAVLVQPLASEYRLRNLAWIEANRRRVAEATDGQVGYVFVPSTGIDGQNELVRMFLGQAHLDGLIIDERWNNGGQIPDRFIELLNRPVTNFWAVRDGQDWQWPPIAHAGPKVMLMNEWSGSGGDMFPWLFRENGLGPLVGETTWGGLIGISGAPPLVDGGSVTVPTFAIYGTNGEWVVEPGGVAPDIEVEDDPTALARGRDPQLEAAIAEVLRLLEQNPPVRPMRPAPAVRVPEEARRRP